MQGNQATKPKSPYRKPFFFSIFAVKNIVAE